MNLSQKRAGALQERTSTLLKRAALEPSETDVPVGILLYRLRRRSFGGLLFFLSILSLIPGISIFAGIVMIILSVQLLLGFKAPKLPRFMSEYRVSAKNLKTTLKHAAPKIERLEKYIQPRLLSFTLFPFTLMIGLLVLCLSAMVIVPLPLTNFLPALSICLMSLGLLERDGLLIFVGLALSVISFSLCGTVIYLTLRGLASIF